MRYLLLVAIVFTSTVSALSRVSPDALRKRPKLVVVLVIDQFRADYLTRFEKRFLPATGKGEVGGFRYLMTQGAYLPFGEYGMLQNMTGPGHATILTGAFPYANGIPLNTWIDKKRGTPVYCAEDADSKPIGFAESKRIGTSPRNMLGSTIGDELKNAGYGSRVVSISLKDRASIFMGGYRADQVIWFDEKATAWGSSRFYFPDGKLPAWVERQNEKLAALKGKPWTWKRGEPLSGLTSDAARTQLEKKQFADFAKGFPHQMKIGSYEALSGPWGVEISFDAAEAAIDALKLGSGASPDLLALSLSSHDYLGHNMGPNSIEMEEMTVAEDRLLAKFLTSLQKKVGLKNVTLVLTADHGIPADPEWLQANRFPAGRLDDGKIRAGLNEYLGGNYFLYANELNFYLDPKVSDPEKILRRAKNYIRSLDGMSDAVTAEDVANNTVPAGILGDQARKTFFPGRSGDLIAILRPYYITGGSGTSHQTGYTYDRTVPIVFLGEGFRPGIYAGRAAVNDIAPTLSFTLGIVPPSLSEGRVLEEILK